MQSFCKAIAWVKEYIWIIFGILFLIGVPIALIVHYTWQHGWAWVSRLLS